ncbi:MAG: dienelactone hydrolase family protein, partial [Planctomycetes bacterium]|nr:dienelactone hydrolase family protein [Planctomycetota bacterium]
MKNQVRQTARAETRFGWTRRHFLCCGAAAVGGTRLFSAPPSDAAERDVRWLADVQRRPKSVPPVDRTLAPLLTDERGKPIRTLADWKIQRKRLRSAWMKFLGPMPVKRPAVNLKVIRTDRTEKCTRQLVRYDSETGISVEGYLLRPIQKRKDERKRPGIVALHQTSSNTIDEIAGLTGNSSQHLGLKLASRGFVVFCPRCFLWQNAKNYRQAVTDFQRRHPKTLGMHKMLFDAMRGVDVLTSLPDVDPRRIGAVGHSLG